MKAAVYTQYGSPEVVAIKEVATPVPSDHEVLIRVRATTVNRTDCGFRLPRPSFVRIFSGLRKPRRIILGSELAGDVTAIGAKVASFKPGDRVFGLTGISFGAHAEYVCIREDGAIVAMPAGLSFEEAAAVPDGVMLALTVLRRFGLRNGHRVLIYGASGSIGTAGVQLAKAMGAFVTAVCNTKSLEVVRSLGPDEIVDYTKGDFTTSGQTYDLVFDAVGKLSLSRCRSLLKEHGTYISTDLGFLAQNPFLAVWSKLTGRRRVLFPIPKERKEDVSFLKTLIEEGRYKPVIDRRYALDEIVEAYRYVECGEKIGNVVITVR